jgi:hypothetical protein
MFYSDAVVSSVNEAARDIKWSSYPNGGQGVVVYIDEHGELRPQTYSRGQIMGILYESPGGRV